MGNYKYSNPNKKGQEDAQHNSNSNYNVFQNNEDENINLLHNAASSKRTKQQTNYKNQYVQNSGIGNKKSLVIGS